MSKFFGPSQRGEIPQLKAELASVHKDQQKNAIMKVIASMTVGRDVSALFSDVTRLISTVHIDIKKLVYLYVMNTAKSQPERATMLVGPFLTDMADPSPLIRSFAVRTMSSINVEAMAPHLVSELTKLAKDKDPYVRKTVAIAILKLYYISKERAEQGGFVERLTSMLDDSVAAVVANAACAMTEMYELRSGSLAGTNKATDGALDLSPSIMHTLLNALQEAQEWGQAFILDALTRYTPASRDEADTIAERILPRLLHTNAAVVMAAVRVLCLYLHRWLRNCTSDEDKQQQARILSKVTGPLISIAAGGQPAEIRYTAMRNLNVIQHLFPHAVQRSETVKVFFVKYDDPIYLKLEKLDAMLLFVDEKNVEAVLSEFKEYSTEADVEFVRKAVRCVGATAIKLPNSAQQCMDALLELIETSINYVVQEAIVVIRDIFRRYPGKYEAIIGNLCENLDCLDEPDAKAALIWIVGHYSDMIDEVEVIIDMFADTFTDETPTVQMQILTAAVKAFLKSAQANAAEGKASEPSDDARALLLKVLDCATKSVACDIRSRAYFYWRLLDKDSAAAMKVVLATSQTQPEIGTIPRALCEVLLPYLGTVAALYTKHPSAFLPDFSPIELERSTTGALKTADAEWVDAENEEGVAGAAGGGAGGQGDSLTAGGDDITDLIFGSPDAAKPPSATMPPPSAAAQHDPLDFLSGPAPAASPAGGAPAATPSSAPAGHEEDDIFGSSPAAPPAKAPASTPATKSAGGIDLDSAFAGGGGGGAAVAAGAGSGADVSMKMVVPRSKDAGIEVSAAFARVDASGQSGGQLTLVLAITNTSAAPLSEVLVKINKNPYGLNPAAAAVPLSPSPVPVGGQCVANVKLSVGVNMGAASPGGIQIALKPSVAPSPVYFEVPFPAYLILNSALPAAHFGAAAKVVPASSESKTTCKLASSLAGGGITAVAALLEKHRMTVGSQREKDSVKYVTLGGVLPGPQQAVLVDVGVRGDDAQIAVRSTQAQLGEPFAEWVKTLLQSGRA